MKETAQVKRHRGRSLSAYPTQWHNDTTAHHNVGHGANTQPPNTTHHDVGFSCAIGPPPRAYRRGGPPRQTPLRGVAVQLPLRGVGATLEAFDLTTPSAVSLDAKGGVVDGKRPRDFAKNGL